MDEEQNELGIRHEDFNAEADYLETKEAAEKLSGEIQEALLRVLQGSSKVPYSDAVPEWFVMDAGEKYPGMFPSEAAIVKAVSDVLAPHVPDDIKVTVGDGPLSDEDRKVRRAVPINLEMSRRTYNDIFVPMGYEPIPEKSFTISFIVEE